MNVPYTYIGTVGEGGFTNVLLTNNTTGTRAASDLGLPIDTFHIYELAWTSTVTRAFLDRAATPAGSLTQSIPTTSLPIQLGNYNDNTPAGETFEVDWVYLRKYQEPEPANTVGAEEGNNSADLELSLTDTPDPIMVGNQLTYAITITNHGPLAATDVVLTDNLPAEYDPGICNAQPGKPLHGDNHHHLRSRFDSKRGHSNRLDYRYANQLRHHHQLAERGWQPARYQYDQQQRLGKHGGQRSHDSRPEHHQIRFPRSGPGRECAYLHS